MPFLDKAFLDIAMTIDAKEKSFSKGAAQTKDADGRPHMEKYILRKAFDCAPDGKPYLPDEILWRQKEQFSDGVGYSWIDGMKDQAAGVVSDEALAKAGERWSEGRPDTKEAYWIREIFDQYFPSEAAAKTAVRCVFFLCLPLLNAECMFSWIPRGDWGCAPDPSGRSVSIHNSAYDGKVE